MSIVLRNKLISLINRLNGIGTYATFSLSIMWNEAILFITLYSYIFIYYR